MLKFLQANKKNILKKDPSAQSKWAVMLLYPSTKAQIYHKIARKLYLRNRHFLSSFFALRARKITGIDIHPGAEIGDNLFIDHGMGVVIGETAIIKNNVTLFHGVTLGGVGKMVDKRRHPIIEDDVIIGANATVLGPITIGKGAKIGANSVVLKDVPPFATAVGSPARIIER